jgi:hypothetical protein
MGRMFYKRHHLEEFADALPRDASLSDASRQIVAFGVRSGFFCVFPFPPFDLQMTHFERLVEETAHVGAEELPDNQQYRAPFLADDWTKTPNGKVIQRRKRLAGRESGPYLLLFSPEPQTNCWGKTAKQIEEQFQARAWQGLTVPEYLVLQRVFAERHRDHRFFEQPLDESGGHWLWLIDSMTETACSVVMGKAGVINIQATGPSNRESRRAALAGVVVPLS